MKKEDLVKHLEGIEWEDLEFKTCESSIPKSSWETVSAFSNTSGGWLIFGVSEKGKNFEIVGVKNPEKIEQDFTTALRNNKFNKLIEVECKKFEFNSKIVLAFYIPAKSSKEKPIYFGNSLYNTFIRVASGDQRATEEEIRAMHRNSSFEEKDSEICDFGIESLDEKTIGSYRNLFNSQNIGHRYSSLSNLEFLEKLRVIIGDKVSLGGLLVFGKEEYILRKIPSFKIDYLEIDGISYEDAPNRYKFRLSCEYNLFNCFFDIYERLIKNIDIPFKLTSGFRNDDPEHIQALREALVNILMHSDFYSRGTFRIRYFSNRIEFFNNGGLPKQLEFILKEDFTMPRSPIIAKCFRFLKLSEGLGSGFHKMINGWNSYFNNKPIIEYDFDYYKITFYFESKEDVTRTLPDAKENQIGHNRTLNNTKVTQSNVKVTLSNTNATEHNRTQPDIMKQYSPKSRQSYILKELKIKGEIRSIEIQNAFKIGRTVAYEDLKELREQGKIKKCGGGNNIWYELEKKKK